MPKPIHVDRLEWNIGSGCPTDLSPQAQAVADWHDQEHLGPFSTCTEQPCDAVRRVE